MVGELRAGARVDTDDDRGDAGLVGLGNGLVREHVLHRERDHLTDVGAGVVRTRAHGPARLRVQHASGRHDELDLVEEALVLRDLRIHHRGDLPDRVPACVAERRPRLEVLARVAPGEVDRQGVARDGDLHVQVHIGVPQRVVVDVGVGLVDAVGPEGHLFTEALRRVVDHGVDALLDDVRAVAVEHLAQALRRELCRADLRPQVSDVARDSVVGLQRVQHVAALLAAVDDLDDRPADTLAPDVVRGHVVPAGYRTAGVTVVALDAGDQDHVGARSTRSRR